MTAGQSAAERAEWPLEHWSDSEKTAYNLGYAAGAREQAVKDVVLRMAVQTLLSEADAWGWESSDSANMIPRRHAERLRAALAAEEPAP